MSETLHHSTHPPARLLIGPETGKADIAPLLAEFHSLVSRHDCYAVEAMLDAAILASRELAEEVGRQDGELVYLRAQIAARDERIAALERALRLSGVVEWLEKLNARFVSWGL